MKEKAKKLCVAYIHIIVGFKMMLEALNEGMESTMRVRIYKSMVRTLIPAREVGLLCRRFASDVGNTEAVEWLDNESARLSAEVQTLNGGVLTGTPVAKKQPIVIFPDMGAQS
jgi:hypothetical protein